MIKVYHLPRDSQLMLLENGSFYVRVGHCRYVLLRSLLKAARKMRIIL